MRISRRLAILPVLLALAACDGGTLPATDPIHGEWSTSLSIFIANLETDQAEHRFAFRPDGTYESTTLAYRTGSPGLQVVYEGEMKGEYRLEAGGFAIKVRSWRWRQAGMSGWQNEVVTQSDEFSPPLPYTINGDQLVLHYRLSRDEHGQPIPPYDRIYTRR